MNKEAQRIAIAEACGWEYEDTAGFAGWIKEGIPAFSPSELPDYLNDLNAMDEVERTLTEEQKLSYAAQIEGIVENMLWVACGKPERGIKGQLCINTGDPHGTPDYLSLFCFVTATAAQRAEAFLRTLNLWQEPNLGSIPVPGAINVGTRGEAPGSLLDG